MQTSDPSKWTKPPTYPFIPNHVKKHPKTQTNSAPLYHSATAIHLFGNQQSQRSKPQPASPATLAAGERYLGPNRNTRKWEIALSCRLFSTMPVVALHTPVGGKMLPCVPYEGTFSARPGAECRLVRARRCQNRRRPTNTSAAAR